MANSTTLQIIVDDSSPTIEYIPFPDTLGTPNLLGGWNPYFTESAFASTPGESGNGTSLHLTSHDQAAISLTFFGTGIQLFGNVTEFASYDLQLDGQMNASITAFSPSDPTLLASYTTLSAGNHTLTLLVHNPTGSSSNLVAFDRAVVLVDQSGTTNISSSIVDDTRIPFIGTWSFEQDNTLASLDGSDTFHTSSNSGDFFSYQFNGSAVSISGFQDFNSGHYSVTVDGEVSVFNAQSSFREPTTLFYMSGLSADTIHNLTVVNLENRLLAIGSINVTTINTRQASTGPASGLPGSTIAAIVVASILGAFLFGLLAFILYRRHRLSFLPRHGAANEDVLDSDIVIEADEMDERKPPSKVSVNLERRDGSNNSRSFTLSLPMQQSHSRGSPRDDHSPSIQELPRSPSVSLVGTHVRDSSNNGNGGDKAAAGRKATRARSASQPYAVPPAQYPSPPDQYRPQPRQSIPQPPEIQHSDVATNEPISPLSALAGYDAALASAVAALQPPLPATASGQNTDVEPDSRQQSVPKNAHSTGFSFLDISSRESSGQDDQESPVHTSSSGSWGPRFNRMSQQTGRSGVSQQSSGRPVSMGYAMEHERGADFGLFRPSQSRTDANRPPESGPLRRSSEPTLLAIPPNVAPTAPPLRPLPRIPQFPQLPTISPPSAGPSRTEGLPVLSLQTRFDFPSQPASAHLSQPRERELSAAATTAGLSATIGRLLRPPSFGGGRRRSLLTTISPTESVPLTVSDIQFRKEDDEDENENVPTQSIAAPAQRSYASPFILQTLRGEHPSIGSPSEHIPSITHNPSAESVERLPGSSSAPGLERQRR